MGSFLYLFKSKGHTHDQTVSSNKNGLNIKDLENGNLKN